MAKKLTSFDFAQNEIQNVRAQSLASAPGSPVAGQFWYNTTTGRLEFRGAAANIDPSARANHTGTQTAASISDFDSQVRTSRLDQMAAPTASLSAGSQRIINLATPTSASDACTKAYVDSAVNGTDWKPSVRAVATSNVTLSGTQTIDAISLIVGDRVLCVGQTTASQNGIYVVASGAWSRAADSDATTLSANASVFVEEGTVNADTQWRLGTNNPITVGTTSLAWTQIGSGTSYTQGNGISIAGSVISVDTAVTVRKFAQTIGDGTSTSIAITHSLGTQDVTWSVRQVSDNAAVECDVVCTSTSQATFTFATAPASSSLRVVIHG